MRDWSRWIEKRVSDAVALAHQLDLPGEVMHAVAVVARTEAEAHVASRRVLDESSPYRAQFEGWTEEDREARAVKVAEYLQDGHERPTDETQEYVDEWVASMSDAELSYWHDEAKQMDADAATLDEPIDE